METRSKVIAVEVAPETEARLLAAAERKGVSAADYCRAAISDSLEKDGIGVADDTSPKFDIDRFIALRKKTFGDRVLPTDSAEMIREAREERTRQLDNL